jgi:Protein of unknown function (DUF3027)
MAPGRVGDALGVEAEADRVVTHYFECLDPAYRGWRWAVTVARAARARHVTVSDSVLLPGEGALVAPSWLPWHDRLRPGDLRVGDLLPTRDDDERLAPGYTGADDDSPRPDDPVAAVAYELGLGRVRVLSVEGRDQAADRWWTGDGGPDTPLAKAAPAPCSTCGFLVTLGGPLRLAFGICANVYSPSDGRVVAMTHGCGAHSEAAVVHGEPVVAAPRPVVDEVGYDLVDMRPAASSVDGAQAEDLGHS